MSNLKRGVFLGEIATTKRLCALTDGVYAIIIALLVLELKDTETQRLSEEHLVSDILGHVPSFLSYFASFGIVAFLWMKNHWIFKYLKESDELTFWLNFMHLLFLALTPYTASLFGHYGEEPVSVVLFSGGIGMASLFLFLLHRHIVANPQWHEEGATGEWANPNWWEAPVPIFATGSILLSFFSVQAAIALWLLFPVWIVISLKMLTVDK